MFIELCTRAVLTDWITLRQALWPDDTAKEHDLETAALLDRAADAIAFLARADNKAAVGFAEATLRRDNVNGCTSTPVAFLEGVYVNPDWRKRGVARLLCRAVEDWAIRLGCSELASDTDLLNTASQLMHVALGFAETERVVFFRRPLAPGSMRHDRTRVQPATLSAAMLSDAAGDIMSDLHEEAVLAWSKRQADLLRLLAAGERVNDQIDWENVIEEVESVSRTELHRTESLLTQALRHRLKIMAWPNSPEVPQWQEEATLFQMDAARAFQGSMRQRFDLALIYRRARDRFPLQIDGQPPRLLPDTCPVTLDELMTEP
jgi:aminoglycoside 6'-N-acetyltransferase I